MNYICVAVGYFSQIKTLRLVKILKRGSDSLPIRWWTYAALNQQDGQFERYSDAEFGEIFGVNAKEGLRIRRALTASGFMDPDGSIHGWGKWNHYFVQYQNGKASVAIREAKKNGGDPGGSPPRPEKLSRPRNTLKGHGNVSEYLPNGNEKNGRERADGEPIPGDTGTLPLLTVPTTKSPPFRRLEALKNQMKKHPGRPGGEIRYDKDPKNREKVRNDFFKLSSKADELEKQIANE